MRFSFALTLFVFFSLAVSNRSNAQMRQIHLDAGDYSNDIVKTSFYSPSEGYVAFRKWIGYTTDSGKTFTRRDITRFNVDWGLTPVDYLSGFEILALKAFDANNIVVTGSYGLVPAILRSNDGGLTFKLVYHNPYPGFVWDKSGVTDISFIGDIASGFAIDADRILFSNNRGMTWTVAGTYPDSYFTDIADVWISDAYIVSSVTNKLFRVSLIPSLSIQQLTLPPGEIRSAGFSPDNSAKYVSMVENGGKRRIYYMANNGQSWVLKTIPGLTDASFHKMVFVSGSIGYGLDGPYVYKTIDSGRVWEAFTKQPETPTYEHLDIQLWRGPQTNSALTHFWAGGASGNLEINTNVYGKTIPKAFFRIDTTGLYLTNTVKLLNYSNTNYQYSWYRNDVLISNTYNASYTHNINQAKDIIKLVVTDGASGAEMTLEQIFKIPPPPAIPEITSFSPVIAGQGKMITIIGKNFSGTTAVSLGGTPCATFTIVSNTRIDAIVENGSSGIVSVTNNFGTATLAGFTFVPKPVISSFTPLSGPKGTVITITGNRFTGASAVSIGGIAAASFAVVDDNTITAVLAGGGSGKVSVTTVGGKDEKDGFVFNYPSSVGFVSPSSGGVGDTVFIKGWWFNGAVSVTIGGVNAGAFRVISDTLIEVIIGAGNSGGVIVKNAYGTAGDPGSFTLIGPPVFTSFSPMEAGEDIEVEIVGTGLQRVSKVTFGGVPAKSFGYSTYWGKWMAVVGAGSSGDVKIESKYGSATRPGFKWFPKIVISGMTPSSGTAGTTVTVKGKNFNDVREILVGGQAPSSYNIISDSVITLVVGLGATGDITLKGPAGIFSAGVFTFIASGAPVITSITPIKAAIGASVTISGNNFNTVANLNTVYFGGVRAVVTAASATSLTVTAPPGADYEPISVTTNFLTAYSNQRFSVLFSGKNGFDSSSFPIRIDTLSSLSNRSHNIVSVDVDQDGKQDLVVTTPGGIYIYRNKSANGVVAFETAKKYGTNLLGVNGCAVGDLDGDGKIDIATPTVSKRKILLLKNNSTPGNIDFSDTSEINKDDPETLAIADINSDGKPDLIAGEGNGRFGVLRNITQGGQFAFSGPSNFSTSRPPKSFSIADINNDGKPDILFGGYGQSAPTQALTVRLNTTVGNSVSFGPDLNIQVAQAPQHLMHADIDGDSKFDLVMSSLAGTVVLRNITTTGAPAFESVLKVDLINPQSAHAIAIVNDLDGDGKPDLIISEERRDSIAIRKNISEPGKIQFAPPYFYYLATNGGEIRASDFDGDGAPEIIVGSGFNSVPGLVKIFTNQLKATIVKVCSLTDTGFVSDLQGTIYKWEVDAGSGFQAIADGANYSGSGSASLRLVSVPVTWNGYKYRCNVDGKYSNTIQLEVKSNQVPTIAIRTDTTTICEGANTIFTSSTTNTDPGYSIQWKINNADVSNSLTGFTTNLLKNGDEIIAVLKANNACVVAPIQSNTIKMTVKPAAIAEVKITSSAIEICAGETVRFKAEIKNGGTNPVYTWKINGAAIVNNTDSLIINTLKAQDQVQLVLTNNATCVASVTSNTITINVNTAIKPSAVITGNTDLKIGEPSSIIAIATNAGNSPAYQWQDSTTAHTWRQIPNASGQSFGYKPFSNGDKLRVKVRRNGSCPDSVFSNTLIFKVQEPDPAPNSVISYPNPVQNTLIIDSLSSIDEWTSLEITNLNGDQKLVVKNIANQIRVRIEVGHLPKGIYFVIVRRNFGAPAYLKFVKM